MSNILEIKHLKKYYGKSVGVEDVTLSLKNGEIYGFIGPNGAGKSTTIRTIMGLINKTEGKIFFNGQELNPNNIRIKKQIGYLPSEVNLYGNMKVSEILNYNESIYKENINNKRTKLVKLLKIDESKKIEDLSLGNLKKIGIVLALMHSPKLLILDEPTSGLDPLMQKVFHDILKAEKELGTTILYSSHVLSEVSNLCDRIGFIKDGVIIKEDDLVNIKNNDFTYLRIKSNEINEIKKELGLKIKEESETEVVFFNDLDANTLLKKLSKYDIEKLLIEEVTLEDLFDKYYR